MYQTKDVLDLERRILAVHDEVAQTEEADDRMSDPSKGEDD